jgi:N-acetylglucosamine-6-phosphate deacetylase
VLLTADTLLTGRELLRPAWIDVSERTVRAVGAGAAPRPADRDLGAATVVPGFVDTHVHGGGGANFSTASRADTSTAVALHRRFGTTTLVASLVTARPAELLCQVTELADDVRAGMLAGIHLEGPWLSTKRCGAHQPALMRDPDPAEVDRVLDAAAGAIRMVTLAPERDGALAAIERIVDGGAVAAVGHTEATYQQTRAAISAGATVGTHLFNAMRPINTREPGPVIALLEDSRVTVEVISDGVHVDPALYRHVTHSVGPDRVSLITDAMAATGIGDGVYHLGPVAVDVVDGVARVAGTVCRGPQRISPRRSTDAGCASGVDQPRTCVGPAIRRTRSRRCRRFGGVGLQPGRDRCAAARSVVRRTRNRFVESVTVSGSRA